NEMAFYNNENLIFLDETGFNGHLKGSYGYSPIKVSAYKNVSANRGTNRSLMCAILSSGVAAYSYKTGSYNSNTFIDFIISELVPYFNENRNKVLIMDNARIHKTDEVQRILREHNIAFRFTVPYSPQLNPIEEFFSMLKAHYNSAKVLTPTLSIESILDTIFENNTFSVQCTGFFRNMRNWLEKLQEEIHLFNK
ncbi:MAG: transposase, partial [Romboutsia sp.]|nr:transposase [Romboutsia sp.]